MIRYFFVFVAIICTTTSVTAQKPNKWNSVEIYHQIEKLNFLGSALYIAAHPDDENTRMISYLANEVKARTGYLSLTRGDGGQNLIGSEIRELLGVIRTQELLTARAIDGGSQLFTRANDFGYSKHPDETLQIWNKDSVLSDVVWAIRNFRPDIIINRFDHRTSGSTHGHHTSSAILSVEAFDLAGDSSQFPSQLKHVKPWQPKRSYFNTSWWFYGSKENFEKADKSKLATIDTGVYFPYQGVSNSEIAALSRSQHKSQGFGTVGSRGSSLEYLELIQGDSPQDVSNLFEGIDTTWNRVKNGNEIKVLIDEVLKEYDFKNPSASVPKLITVYTKIINSTDSYWRKIKGQEVKAIIAAASGLYLEATTDQLYQSPGDLMTVQLEAINRSNHKTVLQSVTIDKIGYYNQPDKNLTNNQNYLTEITERLQEDVSFTSPYWLNSSGTLGMYTVTDQNIIGQPETAKRLKAQFTIAILDTPISFEREIVHKKKDPVKGEVYQPLEIVPKVAVNLEEDVFIFTDATPKKIPVTIHANSDTIKGSVSLKVTGDWKSDPAEISVALAKKGESKTVFFTLTPPSRQNTINICPDFKIGNTVYSKRMDRLTYDHIPNQTVILPSEAKAVKIDLKIQGKEIGYINGAGDVVPESLRQIGYQVTTINPEEIELSTLQKFDAVITGIRAYNILESLKYKQATLLQYVKEGGNLIVQYNTNRQLKIPAGLGPYPLTLSRDRVTDETAEVRILHKNHPALNTPNTITTADFEGWVQERGLYFPKEWSKEYIPLLGMSDKNESLKEGSLLVAPYGKGYYVYTGLSFFREFPAGVPGAYRLFANLISLGK